MKSIAIHIQNQVNLNNHFNLIWSGWMGGQWAFTPEILPYIEGRSLTVLCGGPGDLCLNALMMGCTPKAVSVDASPLATRYGTLIKNFIATQPNTELDSMVAAVEKINKSEPGVPIELARHSFPPMICNRGLLKTELNFEQQDALSYLTLQNSVAKIGSTFWYLATPTVLPDGVLSNGRKHFYQLYDPFISIRVNWSDNKDEFSYLSRLLEEIERIDPQARICFGVGEGDTSIEQYHELFAKHGRSKTVLEKTFQGDGYQFTDWLIICDLGAQ